MSHDSDVASLNSPPGELASVREELKLYQQLIAGNCDGLWHRDLKTGNLWVSDQWWRILGYDPQKAPTHIDDFKKLIHPDDIQKLEAAFTCLMAGKEEYSCEYRLRDAFGNWRVVLSRGKAGTDIGTDSISYLAGSHFDKTELALKEQKEQTLGQIYDRVFHSIPHLIIVKDEHDRFVYANKALAEFWGENDFNKLIGKKDEDYNPDKEEVAEFLKNDAEVRRTRKPTHVTIERNTDHRGKKHWLNTIKVPLVNKDGSVYVIIVATFIDDVIELAEKVKKHEELPKLARNLAHKLGTRIFTLRNLVAIVQHDADAEALEAAFDDIGLFAEDFLKLTSADRINYEPINLLSIMHHALKPFAEKAKITLNNRVVITGNDTLGKFGLPSSFDMVGDHTKLYDVFAEITKNSLVWAKKDRPHRITVSVQPCHLTPPGTANLQGTERYQIIIEDNGAGVPKERKRSIFQPFVSGRAEALTSEDHSRSGTGLGLAIAEEVIKSHGGTIKEEGEFGIGARFIITLQKNRACVQSAYQY